MDATHTHDHPHSAATPAAGGATAATTGIGLSEKAAREILRIIRDNHLPETTALRVGAKGGGCSGFSYVLDFDRKGQKSEFDDEFLWHGVKVLIDKKSVKVMAGTVIDFNDSDLLNRGFVFQNPTATGTCGCGTSFSV